MNMYIYHSKFGHHFSSTPFVKKIHLLERLQVAYTVQNIDLTQLDMATSKFVVYMKFLIHKTLFFG